MARHDLLYRLYDEFDTATLREYQSFIDVLPPIDSRVVLDQWQGAHDELQRRVAEVEANFVAGETFANVARVADREQAFTALDLLGKYDRPVNVLVLDIDETLRSAGNTDNEIPRATLHRMTEFVEAGVPIVICTGQTLENVKGAMIQGLGSEVVHSGDMSVVYEAGTGVFTPRHGADTKRLLYETLDDDIQGIFTDLRSQVLSTADEKLRRGTHLQGNEFNVTMKPNFATGSSDARAIIDRALVHLLDLLGRTVADRIAVDGTAIDPSPDDLARAYYAEDDPEIRAVLDDQDGLPSHVDATVDAPEPLIDTFERIDVAYYEGDAAEIGSLELNKVAGVESAFDVLGIDDPFALVMGDSKTDLRVMEWAEANDAGISAAPEHASQETLAHVVDTEGLVFDRGQSADILGTVWAMNQLASIEDWGE